MNNVSGSAEVHDHRYGAGREGLKDHGGAVVTNRRKHQHVRLPQSLLGFIVAEPSTERYRRVDSKRSREPLEAVSLGAVADYCKAGQIAPQKGGGCAQCEITSLYGDQPTDKD